MKRISVFLLTCLLFVATVGCAEQNRQSSPPQPAPPEPVSQAVVPEAPPEAALSQEEASSPEHERLVVMDTPLYRGVVTAVSEKDGMYELRLEQVEGADYGYPSFTMHTGEETRADFSFADLVMGDYLEVYYGERNDGMPPVIIAANRLPAAVDCVFNGTLTVLENQDGKGYLELTALASDDMIQFNFDDSTQFYLDLESLKPGDQLNIFHRGTLTRSIPPQGFALEVRPYKQI